MADDLVDHQHDQAVVEQQLVVGAQILRQRLVVQADALLVAQFAVFAPFRVQDEFIAVREVNLTIFKLANADFRTLHVRHDRHFAAAFGCRLAHQAGAVDVILCLAVREVQANDVDTGTYHFDQDIEISGGWADRCDNFSTTGHSNP